MAESSINVSTMWEKPSALHSSPFCGKKMSRYLCHLTQCSVWSFSPSYLSAWCCQLRLWGAAMGYSRVLKENERLWAWRGNSNCRMTEWLCAPCLRWRWAWGEGMLGQPQLSQQLPLFHQQTEDGFLCCCNLTMSNTQSLQQCLFCNLAIVKLFKILLDLAIYIFSSGRIFQRLD